LRPASEAAATTVDKINVQILFAICLIAWKINDVTN